MPSGKATLRLKLEFKDQVDSWVLELEAWIRRWISATAALIEEYAKDEAPANLGELRDSIHANVTTMANAMMAEVGTKCGYGIYIEKGTDPHWPPPGPLEAWAARVLGDARLGFVVGRAIAERGTDSQPFLYPAYERALNEQLPKWKTKFS